MRDARRALWLGRCAFSLCLRRSRCGSPIPILRRVSPCLTADAARCCLLYQRRSRYARRALRFWLYAFLSLYARRAAAPVRMIVRRASLQAPVCYCLLCQHRSRYTRRALRFWLYAFLAVREARCGSGSDCAPCLTADAARCCILYQRRSRYARRALRFWLYAFLSLYARRAAAPIPVLRRA
jgi:hypothetical protein